MEFLESHVLFISAVWGAVCFRLHFVQLFRFFPLPFPPSLVDLGKYVCPAQGSWLKARCSPQNHQNFDRHHLQAHLLAMS